MYIRSIGVLELWPALVRHTLTLDRIFIGFAIMILYFFMVISGLGQGIMIQMLVSSITTLQYSITPKSLSLETSNIQSILLLAIIPLRLKMHTENYHL